METQKPVVITDTDSAREYLVRWMREHFPSDRTFSAHIRAELAGDFAWQLANALHAMETPAAAAGLPDIECARARLVVIEQARLALLNAQQAQAIASAMPHWGGIHPDLHAQLRKILSAVEQLVTLAPVILPPSPAFAGIWNSVDNEMPEGRIRVWASTSKLDIGHDCFFGGRSSIQEDQTRLWRYTFNEKPVENPVSHWMDVPSEPPGSEDLRDPFTVLTAPRAKK